MKKLSILLSLTLILLTSCFYAYYPQTGSTLYSETNPAEIQIYSGDIDSDYEIIGSVAADAIGDADAVVKHLKKKAAKMGADAIIKAVLSKMNSAAMSTGISGVAVKLKQAGNQ
ncbi:MAG TPA: hypothetical protein VKA10_10765 [Prolixibacteraceae bacterium]|nr:hypothetical protein [Prolixibacteraceae bacterium]